MGQVITGIHTIGPRAFTGGKTMKKLLSIVLALVLVLGLAVVPVFADETTAPTSSTTVTTHPGVSSVIISMIITQVRAWFTSERRCQILAPGLVCSLQL